MGSVARLLVAAVATLPIIGPACSGGDDAGPPVTTAAPVAAPTTSTTDPDAPTVDGVLRLGVLVPETGSQAPLGPAMRAAAELAVEELNDAGGVLGQPVEVHFGDAGDASTDTAGASVDAFAGARVDVIVGPPSSGVTSLVLDKVARSTAALIAPANPLPDPPADLPYLQLAPGLELLGTAVGQHVATNGLTEALIVARDDQFGQRVAAAVGASLEAEGVTAAVQPYNPESEAYQGDVARAIAAGPVQVVFVGYAELADFLQGFILQGVLPSAFPMFVVTDRLDDALFRRFTQPGVLGGLQAIGLGSELEATRNGFTDALRAAAPSLTTTTFAPEVHDAVVLAGLAAQRAGSDAPAEVRKAAASVSGGTGGDACDGVEACLRAAEAADVTFRGWSGPAHVDATGLARAATFAAFPFGPDNRLDTANAVTFDVSPS
jgi:branched-chain amino acid transport system substrate-binding protein